jgi:hypothetical protein
MRKIFTTLLLSATALSVHANGHGWNHHHHGGSNWVGPAIIGGLITYAITRPQVVVQQPPVIVQQTAPSGTIYAPLGQPVYQYQNIWFDDCSCYRQVLVRLQ